MWRASGWTWKALFVLACITYQYLVHVSVSGALSGSLRSVLLWLPLVAFAGWILVRSRNKLLWLAALLAGAGFVYLVEYQERLGLAAVSGISHAAAYLFLLWYFGRTLVRGSEPLVTLLARRVHGALTPDMEVLTRRLTIAWCLFFTAQLGASAQLLAFSPLEAWSLFVNLLNMPLLVLMFAGQWVYRGIRHPHCPRASIWQAIEAFIKHAPISGRAEVR